MSEASILSLLGAERDLRTTKDTEIAVGFVEHETSDAQDEMRVDMDAERVFRRMCWLSDEGEIRVVFDSEGKVAAKIVIPYR
jgi:hypothetical protein